MNKIYLKLLPLFAAVLFMAGCKKDTQNFTNEIPKEKLSDVTTYSPQIAIDWMDALRDVVKNQSVNPPRAARIYAYASITLYESVFEGIAGNKSLQGQLNGFNIGTIPANSDSLDYGIVLNEALLSLVNCDTVIPSLSQQNRDSANALHDRFLSSKTGVVADSIILKSKTRGALVAHAVMAYAAGDNFLSVKTMSYSVPARDVSHSWYWEPTDGGHLNPAEPYWGQVRPFVMASSNACEIPQHTLFDADTSSAFGRMAREVYNTVNNRTVDQSDIRLWWSDATGTQTPAGHWIALLKYVIRSKNFKLDKAAELYALTSITMSDAFISCWDAKYKYNLLRPETYIRAYIQPGWVTGQSDITPPFPEYPSGHSVCSGAAAKVLTSFLGTMAFTDSINVNLGYAARSYPSFDSAAHEAGLSRLYGGIHYRDAIETGLTQGEMVGQRVIDRINFK
jgi:hypothetical protein